MIRLEQTGVAEHSRSLARLPDRIRDELRQSAARLARALTDDVRGRLGGPILTTRSGQLRNSITGTVEGDDAAVFATVATALRYARAQEFGFHGVVTVRQHLRRVSAAFGHAILPHTAAVRAHPMRMALPERSFLRAALRALDASGAIRAEIEAAVARGTA